MLLQNRNDIYNALQVYEVYLSSIVNVLFIGRHNQWSIFRFSNWLWAY